MGFHHGYLTAETTPAVVRRINGLNPDLLLVGMGNPLQEHWITAQRSQLCLPLAMGVGGLFDHWAGNLRRAPLWVRQGGCEWLQLFCQQPHKFRRYILGNPLYLARVFRAEARRRLRGDGRGRAAAAIPGTDPRSA